MKVFISETDRQRAIRIAIVNIAKFYGIQKPDTRSNQSLYNEIQASGQPIFLQLKEYIEAYNNWFSFYERIKKIEEANDREHDLTEVERTELSTLIQRRQEKLNALQEAFDKLQFENFKRSNGLGNVDGIIL
jgi:hypothetical protein